MDLTNLICLFPILVVLFYCYFKLKFTYWRNRGVPCIEPRIPFGNLEGFKSRLHIAVRIAEFYNQLKGKYPFAGIYIFHKPVVLATDLEFVKNILIRDFNNFQDRGTFVNERDDPLTGSVLSVGGSQWKHLRTKLTPTFSSSKVKSMLPIIVEVGRRFQDTLRDLVAENSEIELRDVLARFTIDIIGLCAFGIECNTLKNPNAKFRLMGKKVFDTPRNSTLKTALMTSCREWAKALRMKENHDDVIDFYTNVVRETIDFRKENNCKRNDFMDLLIQLMDTGKLNDDPEIAVGKLTFEQVVGQAFVFFAAGYESSAATMAYTLLELSLHQDIQDKARKVINDTMKKHDGILTYECLMEMTYIDQLINESLRKYPPAGILIRAAKENYKVPGTNKIISKGTTVFIPVYGIHHDPDYYPNPSNYDPDRFAPGVERNRLTFLGFGEGPRNCIGLRFGMMQTRVGIVMLLMNFKFSICTKTINPVVFSTTKLLSILSPKDDLWLRVETV